jgi:methylase of polypeptide subunit release factors
MQLDYYTNKKEYEKISRGRKEGILRLVGGKKQPKILDVGCGRGILGEILKKDFQAIVHGVDFSAEAIRMAQKNIDKAWQMDLATDEWPP